MSNIENDIELQFKTSNSFYFKNIINLISNILAEYIKHIPEPS